jgi:cellulose synthase/poly-beta-1,6-N-acetylglucosamine synthase-like glycosyltransferase
VIYLFYIFAAVLIWFSFRSFRAGVDYLRYFKQEVARPKGDFAPFATVFAPCKGVDDGMLENLDALLSQDYPEYEVIFIVDEESDEATQVIESAWREAKRQVKLVVAPKATDSSQKVAKLREGISYADERSRVFVFVDSDARPSPQWLRGLVAPLAEDKFGAATGYRWFIAARPTLATELRSVWNASIASALGPNTHSNFCWGGSSAITRETFERLNIRERWAGTVSDDFVLTRALKENGLSIKFVPQALTPSFGQCTFAEMLEFTNRQMKITRVYASPLWALSFFGSALFISVMSTAIWIIARSERTDLAAWIAWVVVVAVSLLRAGKSWLRLLAVELALSDRHPEVRRQRLGQMTLWAVTPLVFFINCASAMVSRRIKWRGTIYEMRSATKTVVVSRESKVL